MATDKSIWLIYAATVYKKNIAAHPVAVTTLSIITAIFQVNLGYPVFIEAKADGGGGDIWTMEL